MVPDWLAGDYINACPSLFKVGKYELENYVDGFMRFNRYRIEGNTMSFSSKLVDDTASYTNSMKNKEPQFLTFAYPKPKSPANYIPGIGMKYCADKGCDNQGTMAFVLPDN